MHLRKMGQFIVATIFDILRNLDLRKDQRTYFINRDDLSFHNIYCEISNNIKKLITSANYVYAISAFNNLAIWVTLFRCF